MDVSSVTPSAALQFISYLVCVPAYGKHMLGCQPAARWDEVKTWRRSSRSRSRSSRRSSTLNVLCTDWFTWKPRLNFVEIEKYIFIVLNHLKPGILLLWTSLKPGEDYLWFIPILVVKVVPMFTIRTSAVWQWKYPSVRPWAPLGSGVL